MQEDEIRRNDSFNAFEEILQHAQRLKVDALFLGGDLFHENKPSRCAGWAAQPRSPRLRAGTNILGKHNWSTAAALAGRVAAPTRSGASLLCGGRAVRVLKRPERRRVTPCSSTAAAPAEQEATRMACGDWRANWRAPLTAC